jgi:GNAT superfamily N-acetyltransferase
VTHPDTGIPVRPARRSELDVLVAMVPRLVAFGLPPGRDPDAVRRTVAGAVGDALGPARADQVVLVATDAADSALGFVQVELRPETFGRAPEAYVSALVVGGGSEGRGVGRALMAAAETWARERGALRVALDVFATNHAARAFYERIGYLEDSLTLSKQL